MDRRIQVVRATLIELWSRYTKYDKKDKIYLNGHDNMYPNEMERAIMNSPTGRRAQRMMAKFIAGKGVTNDAVINEKKKYKVSDIVALISDDISTHYGCFIHIGYGIKEGKFVPTTYDVLDYSRCRISKEDDEKNLGSILFKDFEEKKSHFSSSDKQDEVRFMPFNPNNDVVTAQIKKVAVSENLELESAVARFKGQVLYLNLTPKFRYAISPFDSVYNDCDTEYRIGLYDNTMTRSGFLGKTAVLTQGLDDVTSAKIVLDVQNWLGAENSSAIYHLDVEQAENLDNVLKIIQLESQYDDAMFTNLQARIRRNILGAANNIPEALAYTNEGALFGSSGDAYHQMKIFYNEQTESERFEINKTLKDIGIADSEIIPFIAVKTDEIVPPLPIN